jgi:transcriptional regulator with XRE-family HTH domain
MPKNPQRNYVRAWREHRRLTQSRLAEAIGTTGAVISLIEAGERRLSDKWANLIAPVLGTRPGHLFDTDPNDVDTDILEIWTSIPAERRDQAREVLRTFRIAPKPAAPSSARPKAQARRPRPGTKAD